MPYRNKKKSGSSFFKINIVDFIKQIQENETSVQNALFSAKQAFYYNIPFNFICLRLKKKQQQKQKIKIKIKKKQQNKTKHQGNLT